MVGNAVIALEVFQGTGADDVAALNPVMTLRPARRYISPTLRNCAPYPGQARRSAQDVGVEPGAFGDAFLRMRRYPKWTVTARAR